MTNIRNINDCCRNKSLALTEAGEKVPTEVTKEVLGQFHNATSKAESFAKDGLPTGKVDMGIRTFIQEYLQPYLSKFKGSKHDIRKLILEYRMTWETEISGCHDMDEVSLAQFGTYVELEGNDSVLPDGFEVIVQTLAQDIPQEQLMFNHVVQRITWKASKIDLKKSSIDNDYPKDNGKPAQEGNKKCCILCENGSIFEADHVLFTGSLGVLKENAKCLFQPAIPEGKLKAITGLGIGTVDKIFAEFNDLSFLPQGIGNFQFLWDKSKINGGDMAHTWTTKLCSMYVKGTTIHNIMTCMCHIPLFNTKYPNFQIDFRVFM